MSKRRKSPQPGSRGSSAASRAETPPKRQKVRDVFVARPFEGLVDEPEWIALRELVPAASAPLRLAPDLVARYGDRPVLLATVLPMAWPAMTRPDGRVFIGLQRHVQSGDVSRDLAAALHPEHGTLIMTLHGGGRPALSPGRLLGMLLGRRDPNPGYDPTSAAGAAVQQAAMCFRYVTKELQLLMKLHI